MKTIILNNDQIQHKINRIAYQIYESNYEEKSIVLAGIKGNGFQLAKAIKENIESICTLKVILCEISINKKNPLDTITSSIDLHVIKNQSVILVDDVLNTGKTLIYGVAYFLQVPLKQFKTVVLIDRNHKKYPVKADFKGLSLSTSALEHISIEISDGDFNAYLN